MSRSLNDLVAECQAIAGANDTGDAALKALQEAVQAFVADPLAVSAIAPHLDPPTPVPVCGVDEVLFEDDSLTVMLVDTPPGIAQPPHDHLMPVAIGIYEGIEVHRLFDRDESGIVSAGEEEVPTGSVITLDTDAVHAIAAGSQDWCRAIHVYLGAINAVDRSIFHPETLAEEPLTLARYEQWCRPL